MRKHFLAIAALAAGTFATPATAEDLAILDPSICQAFAQVLGEAADKIEKPQVKIEGDSDNACGVHLDQIGLILVPQKDLNPEEIPDAVNSDPGAPLGHLFMSDVFTPVVDGKPLDKSKLRTLEIIGQDGNPQKIHYLALAARHTDDDAWHIYGYGSEEKPVLDVPIGEGFGSGTMPLALEVKDVEDSKGTCYLTIYDRFQTSFEVTYADPPAEEKAE